MENYLYDYNDLRENFINIKNEYRPIPFYHLDGDISNEDEVASQLNGFKKSGYGGVVLLPVRETFPEYNSELYFQAYAKILERLKKLNLKAIYYDDRDFPSGWAAGELAEKYPEALNKMIVMREYRCGSNEKVRRKIEEGILMSVVGYDTDYYDIVDLRDKIKDGYIDWECPWGNWVVLQFLCVDYTGSRDKYVNFLSYEAVQKFIDLTYKRFADRFAEYIGDTVNMTFYDDIEFNAPNRRSWDENFNKVFIEEFGFDPAPYYPALFLDIGVKTAHMKALFFNCRALMLVRGFFKAVADFTKSYGLRCTGHVAEPKTTASPLLYGDGMLYQKFAGAAGLDLVHAYQYGFNGLKLASSSAYNFDKELVACEMLGNFKILNTDIMYRTAMNSFARGVNFMIPHTLWFSGKARIPHEVSHRNPEFKDILPAYNDFIARAQTLLQGGRHICDIALLYPIYSMQSKTNLYEAPAQSFEFPSTPSNADYMNLINMIMNYSCRDLTVLHPETLNERCYTENGILYLSNEINFEQYKVLILPAATMISVKNLRRIKKFFDEGGKIIATTELPTLAFEYDITGIKNYDLEVNEIVKHIFGVSASEINWFKDYYVNKNDNGGTAYFLFSELTAADGTESVDAVTFNKILDSFDIAYDVEISEAPRVKNIGILNLNLPAFRAMNAEKDLINNKGVFNYIHKQYAGCDIYYFSNTTNIDYKGEISLRGRYNIEEWDPHNGKIYKLNCEYIMKHNEIYTQFHTEIPKIQSLFYICTQTLKNI